MKFRQGYINVCKKAERKRRNERRNENDRKKERNIVNLVIWQNIRFQYFYQGNLILYVLSLHFETRNFVLRVQLEE